MGKPKFVVTWCSINTLIEWNQGRIDGYRINTLVRQSHPPLNDFKICTLNFLYCFEIRTLFDRVADTTHLTEIGPMDIGPTPFPLVCVIFSLYESDWSNQTRISQQFNLLYWSYVYSVKTPNTIYYIQVRNMKNIYEPN
jgi:hypothetical protein